MDVVAAAEAPGVSDPSPMGLTAKEVCEIADVGGARPAHPGVRWMQA